MYIICMYVSHLLNILVHIHTYAIHQINTKYLDFNRKLRSLIFNLFSNC